MNKFNIGDIVTGTVTGIENYGVFVSLGENCSGLIHISEISDFFVRNINDYVELNDLSIISGIGIDKKDNEPFFVESIDINLVKNYEIKKITGSNILNYTKLDGKSARPIYWFLNESYFRNKQMIFAVKKHYQSDEPNSVYGEDFYYLEEIDKISANSEYSSRFTINILDNSILDSSNEEYYMIIIANNKSYLYKLNFIHEKYKKIDSCFYPKITYNCIDNNINISHLP